jgi:hypothetical protein
MRIENNKPGIKVRNIDVGKADCTVVLVPQVDKDHVLLNRLLSEDVVIEPVTLTDDLREIDGHDEHLRKGYVRGARLAIRPKIKQTKVAKKPTADKD